MIGKLLRVMKSLAEPEAWTKWKPRFVLMILASVSSAGVLGFAVGKHTQNQDLILPLRQMPPLESYLAAKSFSEVENTKAALQALATDFLVEVRVRHDVSAGPSAAEMGTRNRLYSVDTTLAIQELECGISEFRGTEQEAMLVQELLWVLKKEKQYNRWLDVYLDALYRQPTQPLVRRAAHDAARISEAAGRTEELARALDLVRQIPPDVFARGESLTSTRRDGPAALQLARSSALDQTSLR